MSAELKLKLLEKIKRFIGKPLGFLKLTTECNRSVIMSANQFGYTNQVGYECSFKKKKKSTLFLRKKLFNDF